MLAIKHTSLLLRYGVAVLAVGVAFAIKLLLDPLIEQDVPFLLVFGAIMVSAWYGGLGPGLLATVAAGLTTDYFFLDPKGTVSGFSLETVPLLVFFLEGTLVCLLVEALRAARSRAEGSTLEAERQREHLRRNEEHFRSLVEGMRNYAIFTLDPKGRVGSWNAGAERLEGYKSEEIVGEHFSVFFTEEDVKSGRPERHLEAAAGEGRSEEEHWFVRKDGSWFWAGTILTALHDDEGELRGFSEVTQDITEKKEAERHLEEAEDRLRTLVEHVPAITYAGEVGGDHALAYVSPQIEEVLGYSTGEVIHDLRPTVLDDFGLAAAVRLQVQTLRSEGLEVGLKEALGDERLPPEVETTLFRVAQEALTNVRKHARAAAVHVVLDRSGRAVRLMVRDEGRGFRSDETTRSNGPGQRAGLSGMRERLSLLGGRFELQSEPGSGTTVTAEVEVPTNREDSDDAG
jgi:PAS domain S-box-containing protein